MDWKAAAGQGRRAFLEHQYLQALGHHRQALQLALEGVEALMLRQETLALLRQFEDLPADAALSPSAAASLSGGADKTRSTSPSPKGFH